MSAPSAARLSSLAALFPATMFGAAAVRNKKRKAQQDKADVPRGPYIKPFGPRFDSSELPYFKYKRALEEAKEMQHNISKAKQSAAARRKRRARELMEKARAGGVDGVSAESATAEERLQATRAALARVATFPPEVIESRLKVCGHRTRCRSSWQCCRIADLPSPFMEL